METQMAPLLHTELLMQQIQKRKRKTRKRKRKAMTIFIKKEKKFVSE